MINHRYTFSLFICLTVCFLPNCQPTESCKQTGKNAMLPVSPQKENGMLLIPGGTLHMGGDNEKAEPNKFPKHQIEISAFWVDETEVPHAQFSRSVAVRSFAMTIIAPAIAMPAGWGRAQTLG